MGLFSGLASIVAGSAKKKASKKAVAAQKQGTAEAQGYWNDNLAKAETTYAPYVDFGKQAMGRLGDLVYGDSAAALAKSPGYAFRMDQGVKAIDGSAAAGGVLNSGKTLKDLTRFGQGLASDEYGKEYARLADLTDFGYRADGALQGIRTGTADANAGARLGLADARAAGYLQRGDITAGQIQSVGNIADDIAAAAAGGGSFATIAKRTLTNGATPSVGSTLAQIMQRAGSGSGSSYAPTLFGGR